MSIKHNNKYKLKFKSRLMKRKLCSFDKEFYVYSPKIHGSLEKYLQKYNGITTFPLFRGIEWFYVLRDRCYLLPEFSTIRLMWNVGRGDEHFDVDEDYRLVGIGNGSFHAGRPGVHKPEDIIKDAGPCFEAFHLALTPDMKKSARDYLKKYKERQRNKSN